MITIYSANNFSTVFDLTLDKAAELSDKILEVTSSPVENFADSHLSAPSSDEKIFREIGKLNKRIYCLSFSCSCSQFCQNTNYHEKSAPKSRDSSICWYHHRFRKKIQEKQML